ncbi:MAG: glucose-6-phosphate isomerase [Methylohalobius sp.]|nr:glucose-6-phosphate isomerase [Methylohalobius sp.]
MTTPTILPAWQALAEHRREMEGQHLRHWFARDSGRFQRFSLELGDIVFDFSKNLITDKTLGLLLQLAEQCGLAARIGAMFAGEKINRTENRAVLHIALRNRSERPIWVNGQDVMPKVRQVLSKMRRFTEQVRGGQWRGFSGKPITDVVNLGIGGSDLGPRMVAQALTPYHNKDLKVHFVANVDESDLLETLKGLNQETTLFLVASKTFTTQETMANANSAREWLLTGAGGEQSAIAQHFVAISTNRGAVQGFGIDPENMFEFWDWVGGRYSLWSAVGLSIALAVGMDRFEELLEGAFEVDEHFRTAPFSRNIPVIMGLLGIWYRNFWDAASCAILPYDHYLRYFPDHLQQLDMESNGKRVDLEGKVVSYATGPIVWGQVGTNGQHSFFQLLHQGTHLVPCDFIVAAQSHHELGGHHAMLLANCLAQAEALMKGKSEDEVRTELAFLELPKDHLESLVAAKTFPGNRPSNLFLVKKLTPKTLGSLIAFYEHKVFVQGTIWNINSFDQMGVELGKQLAGEILPALQDGEIGQHDASTRALIEFCRRWRGK